MITNFYMNNEDYVIMDNHDDGGSILVAPFHDQANVLMTVTQDLAVLDKSGKQIGQMQSFNGVIRLIQFDYTEFVAPVAETPFVRYNEALDEIVKETFRWYALHDCL
ncbi:hypothetical protein [Delftia phage PhiW-14]|uniref:Uncharacterized protein n=1 Tax=Delftia phage PhiW-14 TaxID=665032 RepID=C9DGD0_BPW14|nr:hypothetical protein DP-phiW-14_gp160 [Delftia phage PhiW-14]ACV50181.1 hypothetical protein [Delftia phage PhiW-14]